MRLVEGAQSRRWATEWATGRDDHQQTPADSVKHGRPIVLLIGVALMVVGLVVLVEWSALGLAVIVIGLVAVVLAAFVWHEFEARITRWLNLRVTHAAACASEALERPQPDICILGIYPTGGSSDHVDFRSSA